MPSIPSQSISQYYRVISGTTSQNIYLKPTPTPIIIVTGKNKMASRHRVPSCSLTISKLKPKRPAMIETMNIAMMTKRSLEIHMKIIKIEKGSRRRNLIGSLMINPQVYPQV